MVSFLILNKTFELNEKNMKLLNQSGMSILILLFCF